jgi:replication protein
VCASSIIAQRRVQVIDALAQGRLEHPGASWRMITLTIRHREGMPLRALIKGLLAAWRKTRQRGSVQRIWKAHVLASMRAIEITRGEHGWHPHLHVLVLVDGWPTWEPAIVADTWETMVTRELSVECTPSRDRGVWWSHDVDDRYLAKLGLEITGTSKGNSAWSIAKQASDAFALARTSGQVTRDRLLDTAQRLTALWREYEFATKGVRAIELDDRAAAMAKRGELLRLAGEQCSVEEHRETKRTIVAMSGLMRDLGIIERRNPAVLAEVLHVAERAPPGDAAATAAVHEWIAAQKPARLVA